jgi:hypothetical protein
VPHIHVGPILISGGPHPPSARGRSGIGCRVPGCEASFGECGEQYGFSPGGPQPPSLWQMWGTMRGWQYEGLARVAHSSLPLA